jgi:hypothetical protein
MKELRELYNKECQEMIQNIIGSPEIPGIRYHYTSFNNLKRILENQTLSFTHFRHLNDPTEVDFAFDTIEKTLMSNNNTFFEHPMDVLKNILYPQHFKENSQRFMTIENLITDIYIFSFCEKPDDLPMWRWYGDNGKGISIGFKPEYFKTSIKPGDTSPVPILTKVFYDQHQLEEIASNLENITKKYIGKLTPDKIHSEIICQLMSLLASFKYEGYQGEQEQRLYYLETEKTTKQGKSYFPFDRIPDERRKKRPIKRKITEGVCLPYFDPEIPYILSDKFSLDDIAEIWVGPCVHFDCMEEQIKKLLVNLGDADRVGGIKIIKSNAPYRA